MVTDDELDALCERVFMAVMPAAVFRTDTEFLAQQLEAVSMQTLVVYKGLTVVKPGTWDRPEERYYVADGPFGTSWGRTADEAWEKAGSGPALFYMRGTT